MFESEIAISSRSWQAFERDLSRLLICRGYENVRLVGQTNDHGADVVATKFGKKWLFQAKHWKKPAGISVLEETLGAAQEYGADIPVIVASSGFDHSVKERHLRLLDEGIRLQLWDSKKLILESREASRLGSQTSRKPLRDYQEDAVREIMTAYLDAYCNRALVVLATGLGKTYVAAEAIRRIKANEPSIRVLVCAHTNDLVYQLERAFWPFLSPSETTLVFNSNEKISDEQLASVDYVFACIDSVVNYIDRAELPAFDVVLIDECHHVGSGGYDKLFEHLSLGSPSGPFALGLTATPWRADRVDIAQYFGEPRISVDMIDGLKKGFLANVDYRMYTDNINWDSLAALSGSSFSPKQINRTLFIEEWDDAVVLRLKETWQEQRNPRAIVFCGTIDHAKTMKKKVNQLGFCRAEALYSGSDMNQYARNRILNSFANGDLGVICVVDIFNEGIDVPDVNIIVFQRVTHSRRIFIQQLGRGLRLSEGKDKVIVLDFVSDIRRYAAGLEIKNSLEEPTRVSISSKVTFMRAQEVDGAGESFLREWLNDVVAIEDADEDASVLKYPPPVKW